MGYNFDGPNRKIYLTTGTTESDIADMYSRWYDWWLTSDNSKYLMAFRNVGGDPTSDTAGLGITYFLMNNWRIVPQSADHRLQLNGNLYTDPFGYSPVDTVPGYSIVVEYSKSNLIDRLETGVSGLTTEESDKLLGLPELSEIPPAVRTELATELAAILATRAFIGNRLRINKETGAFIVYAADKVTPMFTGLISDDGTYKDRTPD